MTLLKPSALNLALVALLGLTAVAARAEIVSKGTFTLPEQAYWGQTLLPSGDYSMVLTQARSGSDIITLRGENVTVTFFTPAGYEPVSGHACLKLDSVNGTYVVRELDDSVFGRAYQFDVPKAVKEMSLHSSAHQPVTIPVS